MYSAGRGTLDMTLTDAWAGMKKRNHGMRYLEILDIIYRQYYADFKKHSDVTSSFWRDFGDRHQVRQEGGRWQVFGYGLGSFVSRSFRHTLRHFPAIYLSKKLLRDYRRKETSARSSEAVAPCQDEA